MDALFFKNLLVYVSDVASGKVKMDMLQMMLTQHVTNTAMIMFPKAWWLGPIRWWIPWHLQGAMAGIARLMGYTPQMKAYTSDEDRRLLGKVGWSE